MHKFSKQPDRRLDASREETESVTPRIEFFGRNHSMYDMIVL